MNSQTAVGKARITKVTGSAMPYCIHVREAGGWSSPRYAKTKAEAEAFAARLEAGYAEKIRRLRARNAGEGQS